MTWPSVCAHLVSRVESTAVVSTSTSVQPARNLAPKEPFVVTNLVDSSANVPTDLKVNLTRLDVSKKPQHHPDALSYLALAVKFAFHLTMAAYACVPEVGFVTRKRTSVGTSTSVWNHQPTSLHAVSGLFVRICQEVTIAPVPKATRGIRSRVATFAIASNAAVNHLIASLEELVSWPIALVENKPVQLEPNASP